VSEEELTALRTLGAIGANNAAQALTKMLGTVVSVVTVGAKVLPIEKLAETIGSPEDVVSTINLPLYGDVSGSGALIFPQKSALKLSDLLNKKKIGTTNRLDKMDESSLKEAANIVVGTFLAALSNYVQLNMVEGVPALTTDMVKSTVEDILARFSVRLKVAVAFQIDFEFGAVGLNGYSFVLFDPESAQKVLTRLSERLAKEGVLAPPSKEEQV
jgi:chemotaxis protein CheC